jgi:putative ABC transport system ATP-binding protein
VSVSRGAAVTAESVSKHFQTGAGVVRAVNDITLHVPPGTSLAIEGPTGCGKSTLLSLIGALEAPSSGRVSIAGEVVSELSERRRAQLRRERIGFVFQNDNLQPFLTASENVSLALSLTGSADGYGRVGELLDELGLAGLAGRYPDALSGGERQRVAIARALVHRPSLILADEPTGALDTENSKTVIGLLRAAQRETGATLVVITHNPDVAAQLDRRVQLRDGRLCEDGVPGANTRMGMTDV